jgi:hypothetical protein
MTRRCRGEEHGGARSLVMAAMATACMVAVLYDGEERPGMVAVVAAVRGRGGGVLHSAFDHTNS